MYRENRVLCRNGARELTSKKPISSREACVPLRPAQLALDHTTGTEILHRRVLAIKQPASPGRHANWFF
jgi:hypothetical protein